MNFQLKFLILAAIVVPFINTLPVKKGVFIKAVNKRYLSHPTYDGGDLSNQNGENEDGHVNLYIENLYGTIVINSGEESGPDELDGDGEGDGYGSNYGSNYGSDNYDEYGNPIYPGIGGEYYETTAYYPPGEGVDVVYTEEPYVDPEVPYVTEEPYVDPEVPYVDTGLPYVETEPPYVDTGLPYVETEPPYVETVGPYEETEKPYEVDPTPYVEDK